MDKKGGFNFVQMAASLAFLGIVRALTIDNQLTVIKNDCYERMAIGQRLAPKNVYRTFHHNTVSDCQMACTQEKDVCKAFSFGISAKGNATCELSADHVKETADLKPIGTLIETDFDLYIKKLGCKLVIEKPAGFLPQKPPLSDSTNYHHGKPPNSYEDYDNTRPDYNRPGPPDDYGATRPKPQPPSDYDHSRPNPSNSYGGNHQKPPNSYSDTRPETDYHKPGGSSYDQSSDTRPQTDYHRPGPGNSYETHHPSPDTRPQIDYHRPNPGNSYDTHHPSPSNQYENSRPKPPLGDETYQVQTLVSIASGPQTFLHPVHEILVGEGPYAQKPDGYGGDMPPFRPPVLNHLYDDHRPMRPLDYDRPDPLYHSRPGYGDGGRPPRPIRPEYDMEIPRPMVDRYDDRPPRRPFRPEPDDYFRPSFEMYRPRPIRPLPNRYGSYIPHPDDYNRPYENGYLFRPNEIDRYDEPPRPRPPPPSYESTPSKPPAASQSYDKPSSKPGTQGGYDKPGGKPDENNPNASGGSYAGSKPGIKPDYGGPNDRNKGGSKPIVTQSVGYGGERITSIITEIPNACFRRVLAGKRVTRGFVKRALSCENVEDCQRECADEKYFACEGFNYRLDPSGRSKGECELLERPLSHLDIGRDLFPDPDYDYYERDRNAASANCRQRPNGGYYYGGGGGGGGGGYHQYHSSGGGYNYGGYADRRYDIGGRRPGYQDDHSLRRPGDRWPEDDFKYGSRRPPPRPEIDRRYDYGPNRPLLDYRPTGNRRGDFSYHQSHHSQHNYENSHNTHFSYHFNDYDHQGGDHFKPINPPSYYLPPRHDRPYHDRDKDHDYWGLNNYGYGGTYGNSNHYQHNNRNRFDEIDRRHYYLPAPTRVDRPKDWGMYGGSYGNGGVNLQYNGYGHGHSFDYWGLNNHKPDSIPGTAYLPAPKPFEGSHYLPQPQPFKPSIPYQNHHFDNFDNSILPAEPRRPVGYDFLKDECSLRSATGFRLHKGIVKKFFAVPNIYECELLCFKEKDFPCASYAFRYTISSSAPTDNCYLSNRNYKELDYYTDLEPDRDFDIYTMNNQRRCEEPVILGKDTSECFWRVRSGQRLDHKVVRDSLSVKSIVDCQIECLKTRRFTCRAYSFRYGSPVIGGAIDNCQLTDWPFYELDPRIHFIPEPGFEVYERGSFGHGCEPDHFGIRGRHHDKDEGTKVDQLCYIGFGSPARLLPQATRKSLWVPTELECKAECSRAREGTLFQCMSFSYRTTGPKGLPNCDLSDILQRDLLPYVDYIHDTNAWLFAWDNYNPRCIALAHEPIHDNNIGGRGNGIDRNDYDRFNALDTWRVYSVSGWPCKRGQVCKENREAGFWFCELEGGEHNAWDYCCRPDHQCGASNGYPYQWCFVGPARTQWRKCSERYYPYIHNILDRLDNYHQHPQHHTQPYLPLPPNNHAPPYRPGIRPNRPPASPVIPPPRPSLDEYEMQFDSQFLDPPKPGGFGQPRHWPVSYLHKEMPPNNTDSETMLMKARKEANPKFAAIQNLIDVIKSNDLKNIEYHIANESNKDDDILFVRIPLPTNFTKETRSEKLTNRSVSLEPVDLNEDSKGASKRTQKSLPDGSYSTSLTAKVGDFPQSQQKPVPIYRKSYIERTNVTLHGRRSRNL